jgi:hypothetical protein
VLFRSSSVVAGNIAATFDDGNTLSTIASADYDSAGTVIGAAAGNAEGNRVTASSVTANFNGSQVVSALAYGIESAKVNTFGADKTDRDERYGTYGWRVGIFAAGSDIVENEKTVAHAVTGDSTVNILGAKMGGNITFPNSGKAVITLGANQGTSYADYARVFALGEDFKIHVGGRVSEEMANYWNEFGFEKVDPAVGTTNMVNIFGAISAGNQSVSTNKSSLTVSRGWTVNTYGPVENLANITVDDAAWLHTYSSLKNITISDGTVYAHGTSDGIGRIDIKYGRLYLTDLDNGERKIVADNFEKAMADIASKLEYTDSATGTVYKGSDGQIVVDSTNYPWKGEIAEPAKLVLREGDQLIIHVDTSHPDHIFSEDPYGYVFEKSGGYIYLDGDSTISFEGGKIYVINDDPESGGTLPSYSDFWVARMPEGSNVRGKLNLSEKDPEPVLGRPGVSRIVVKDESSGSPAAAGVYSLLHGLRNPDEYSSLKDSEALGVYIFEGNGSGSALVGGGEVPAMRRGAMDNGMFVGSEGDVSYVPDDYARSHANAEIAATCAIATEMVRNAILGRLSDAKNNGTGPFAYAIGGHARQSAIVGFGYSHDAHGGTLGADYRWSTGNKYTRCGALLGCIKGDTRFFGPASGREKTEKHDMYMGALFGAYESFSDSKLKTNFNATLGFGHAKHKLYRVSSANNAFSGNLKSNDLFLNTEFIKNVCQYKGYQFGLWLKAEYNHIKQDSYTESPVNRADRTGVQHVSKTNHDFLDTTVGLSIEREFNGTRSPEKKLALALRAGWQSQPVRKNSSAEVFIENVAASKPFAAAFGYPTKNSAAVMVNFIWKFGKSWNIQGAWQGNFSKDVTCNKVACGLEYDF